MAGTDTELHDILAQSHTIAVVGIKDLETEDAYRIPQYLQARGYRIVPVNPKVDAVLGHTAVDSLRDVEEPVDIVNLFRATEHVAQHAQEILAMSPLPRAVWMQLGIHHGPAAAQLRAAGIAVVQDLCIMLEHRRLRDSADPVQARG